MSDAPRRDLRRILKFAIAGGIGFLVDAAILTALVRGAHWPALGARILSFLGAVSVTWLINRRLTFGDRRATQPRAMAGEYARYLLTQGAGALLNLGIFATALWLHPPWRAQPVMALALASALAMLFNYCGLASFVFARRAPHGA
ncbi:MAG: GtrA family protein [Steroidobacteraceae bacterium]